MHSRAKGSGMCCRECILPPRVPARAAGVSVQWKWYNLSVDRAQGGAARRGGETGAVGGGAHGRAGTAAAVRRGAALLGA
eukprot:3658503-Prymnesium_polylepis.1